MPGDTRIVVATVVALVPDYNQALVCDNEGRRYAITRRTVGVDFAALREGQTVECTVTIELPRVQSATVVS